MDKYTRNSFGFLNIAALTGLYFSNRILIRILFQSAGKLSYIFALLNAFTLISLTPYIHKKIRHMKKEPLEVIARNTGHEKLFKFSKILITFYLIYRIYLTILTAAGFSVVNLLPRTPPWMIITIIFIFVIYTLHDGIDSLLRTSNIFLIFVIIQFFIYIFFDKSFLSLFTLIPMEGQFPKSVIGSIAVSAMMILDWFLLFYYIDLANDEIKPKELNIRAFIHSIIIFIDCIWVVSKFGLLIDKIPFIYYESWKLISFGKYLEYAEYIASSYWVINGVINTAITFFILARIWHFKFKGMIAISVIFTIIFSLQFNHIYTIALGENIFLYLALATLLGSVIINNYLIKKGKEKKDATRKPVNTLSTSE